MKEEEIVLVDDDNNVIGTAPKLASHNAHTPLHRAFSCYVFNEKNQFLVTQRAYSKKTWPGIWSNSCCGHLLPGESTESAIRRRLEFELGLVPTELQLILPDFRYKAEHGGVVENELCPVYLARVTMDPKPNPVEVEAYEWVEWGSFVHELMMEPRRWSIWCALQVDQLMGHPEFEAFLDLPA